MATTIEAGSQGNPCEPRPVWPPVELPPGGPGVTVGVRTRVGEGVASVDVGEGLIAVVGVGVAVGEGLSVGVGVLVHRTATRASKNPAHTDVGVAVGVSVDTC